ncbi:hypothetical protein O181_055234 [Austropuccinia psidii MF-1]|uniref:Uncharacterized protein n=1 Tax=Austropuccinia psidii MF-1 TaxID=1389203 RepID=A0A9Q3E628_9BASI|nr:hypothetical protein [Austropuccinia psidii MF-1]
MNSYLTVRKFLGHPNTCNLLNGWHPFLENKNMMLLIAELRENNRPPPKKVPRTAPVASSSNSNMKKQPQAQNKGKGKESATESQRRIRIPWKMYFRWPEQWCNYTKRRNPTKISEMILDILDRIPNLFIAINDVKSHISDKN